jgi:LacI family transcriptional regulator
MPQEDLEHLLPQLAPVVLINRNPGSGRTPFVTADYHRGLDDILGHVLALGHTRIVYLAGSSRSASNSKRLAAFEAFRERHPDYRLDVLSGGVTFENGYDAAGSVVESGATAVLAYNDLVAMGLLSGLAERGVRVPDEISVAGFDDILFARYTTPSLTTAAVPVEQLGRLAWERLAALLKGEEPPGDVTIEPQLAVRHSTARPGAAS